MTKKKGFFISVEGSEGAGKSTALNYISDYLKLEKIDFISTREPGGTEIAEEIRRVLLAHHHEVMAPNTELMLMFASRVQHIEAKIKPALAEGQWVVTDRFTDASIAYQGCGRQLGVERIESLKRWAMGEFEPDITILLDVPVDIGMERVGRRKQLDRIETEKVCFFERVRAGYLALAKENPKRFRVIDSSLSFRNVRLELKTLLDELIKNWNQ